MERDRKKVGEVITVSGATVTVALFPERVDSGSPARLRWADYVLLECVEFSIIGQITSLDLQVVPDTLESKSHGRTVARIIMLCSFNPQEQQFFIGVREFPTIGASCYSLDDSFIRFAIGSMSSDPTKSAVTLNIGKLSDAGSTPFTISAEAMFGRHCAVVGTSGGGKSWSLARIVEETTKHRCKVIIVDATGEFSGLGWPVIHAHIGKPLYASSDSLEVSLPYFQLLESDLFAVFQPSGDVQAPKLRAAIKTLRLLELEPHLSLNGTFIKANKNKQQFIEAYSRHLRTLESNAANFNIFKLADQLKFECVNEIRSATETDYWGNYNSHDEACVFPLVSRVVDAIGSLALEPIFNPNGLHSLFEIIEWFVANEDARVLSLSLEHLSFLHRARQLVTNSLGRQLMTHARSGTFKVKPLLLVVDEAHQFLSPHLEDRSLDYPLDSFAIIAKEGRKYALNICLATQRPRDIPESVMSQMGTMLVHRLTNDGDRSIIERSCGQADNRTIDSLPALAPGEAILLGIDIPIPLKLAMGAPNCPPMSRGPDYQTYWGPKPEEPEVTESVKNPNV